MRLEWYPPLGGEPLVMEAYGKFTLVDSTGLSEVAGNPTMTRSPGQYGRTVLDVPINERVITMTIAARAETNEESMRDRAMFSRYFFSPPPRRPNDEVKFGTLRVVRGYGMADVQIRALPRNSPQNVQQGPEAVFADVELVCPWPFFERMQDESVMLRSSGGFRFPLRFPLSMPGFNIRSEVNNGGDVAAPPLIRLYGPCTNPRLRKIETGEVLEVGLELTAGEYVEVETAFARKRVQRVSGATRTNAMGRVNLARSDFFWLDPGISTIQFEADLNPGGFASLHWREHQAGV